MIRINLLKPETKDIKDASAEGRPELKARKKPGIGNLIFLLLVLAVAGAYYYQRKAMDRENRLLAQATEEKGKLQYVIAKLDELQRQKSSLERKIGLINLLKSQQDLAVRIMDEVSRDLPEWVWLDEVGTDSKTIQIRGNALSNNLVADFIANLENSAYFESVNLISSAQKTSQNDQFLEFSLTAGVINPKQRTPGQPPPSGDTSQRRLP
jgi:type IV pilus assembly protein PilN